MRARTWCAAVPMAILYLLFALLVLFEWILGVFRVNENGNVFWGVIFILVIGILLPILLAILVVAEASSDRPMLYSPFLALNAFAIVFYGVFAVTAILVTIRQRDGQAVVGIVMSALHVIVFVLVVIFEITVWALWRRRDYQQRQLMRNEGMRDYPASG